MGGAPCYHAPSSISPVLQHMLCNQYILLPMVRSHPTWQPELSCCFQKVLIHCCCFIVSRVFAIHNHMTEPIYSTVGDQPPSHSLVMTIWKSITKVIPLVCNIHIYILWKNALVHIPMCQSEFGPGTEDGRHAVSPLGRLKAIFKGFRVCSACQTLSLVTSYCWMRSWPAALHLRHNAIVLSPVLPP